jgi:excisionase family DNA binding protein
MDLLTVAEAASMLRVNPITIRRHIARGLLPAIRVGRGVRVRREALDQFIRPAGPGEAQGRPLNYGDPLWELVGSAIDVAPTDASKKHEYLADALAPETR